MLSVDVELLVPEGASWMYTAALLALVLLVFPFLYYVAEGFWADAHVWKRSHAVGGGPTRRLQAIWALWSRGMIVALGAGGGLAVVRGVDAAVAIAALVLIALPVTVACAGQLAALALGRAIYFLVRKSARTGIATPLEECVARADDSVEYISSTRRERLF